MSKKVTINWHGAGNYAFSPGAFGGHAADVSRDGGATLFTEYCASLRELRGKFADKLRGYEVEVMNWAALRD